MFLFCTQQDEIVLCSFKTFFSLKPFVAEWIADDDDVLGILAVSVFVAELLFSPA